MDEQIAKILAIIIFALTYIALLVFSKVRAFIAAGSALLFLALTILPFSSLLGTIDWNLLLMLLGIMGTVALFIESGMTEVIGGYIIKKSPNLMWIILILSLTSGIVSAFVDNVATVLILAPIALNIAKKAETSPVPIIIAIAIMSNLQGAATLVGDTTSILLGAEAHMNFFDFFVYKGRMGLFFIVQISMIMTVFFLWFVFRKNKQKVDVSDEEVPKASTLVPSFMLLSTILLLILGSFLQTYLQFEYLNACICVGVFLIGFGITLIKNHSKERVVRVVKDIDFLTLLLIGSLFVIVGGIRHVGVIDDIATGFTKLSQNPFIIYTLIVFASVLLSAFIDNIPYVAAMLPVCAAIAQHIGISPELLYFGLISGATLGGNLTPIGASANITAMGILRKEGYNVKAKEFMKISVPFTLIAVLTGYVLVLVLWI